MATVTFIDEIGIGNKSSETTLNFLAETVSLRELIRRRVYEEVSGYNAEPRDCFHGLVQPADAEQTLNGFRLSTKRKLDWQAQFEKALDAFEARAFIVLLNDQQIDDLETSIELHTNPQVTFLKLVPLVGG